MWSSISPAKTHLCACSDARRAPDARRGVARSQPCDHAPLSHRAGQQPWATCASHRRSPWVRRSDGAPRHSRLQCFWVGGTAAWLLRTASHTPRRVRYNPPRAVRRPPASEPTDLRQTDQPLDLTLGCRGRVCRRPPSSAGQRRGDSARAPAAWRQVATRQALEHQSRPGVRPEKKQRDRLIHLAATPPTWGLGFGDAVWWSRLAPPALHAWAPDAQALHLGEKTRPPADRDPKALACDGLLLRTTPTTPEPVWRRFATGQPVRGLTPQLLAWCGARLGGLGKHALLPVWDNAAWPKSRRYGHGCGRTTVGANRPGVACASSPVGCRVKARG
jgi:hypothetical protein